MKSRHLCAMVVFVLMVCQARASLDILVIGSSHTYSEGNESGVVQQKAFNPTVVANELRSILANDPAISETVNVVVEDIYKTITLDTAVGQSGTMYSFAYRSFSLAQYYMWPEGRTNRLANLRGADGTPWDYVVIMADPYIMANMPGMYAEGINLIAAEVRNGPAEPILLAQWPENSASFSATDFNEVVYRVGESAAIRVVPGGKAWDSLSLQDSSASHPTPKGAYLAASCIYSEIYNKSAKTSGYTYNDSIADHALSVVQANHGAQQYTGTYTGINPFQMKYVSKRRIKYNQTGSSSESGISGPMQSAMTRCMVAYTAYGATNTWPAGVAPVDYNYGRGNDWFEDDKDYSVDTNYYDRSYGFPMQDQGKTADQTMLYGIDKRYQDGSWYEDGTDLGIAYNMIRPGTREAGIPLDARCIPIRLMWARIHDVDSTLKVCPDKWHMSSYLNEASGPFIYTLLSGRCPVTDEPSPQGSAAWITWFGRKTGYETAWRMSHLTTRAPGFQVLPTSTTASNVTPINSQTLSVRFMMAPTSDVTVAVSTDDPSRGKVSPSVLTFTTANYANAQTVTVLGESGPAGSYAFNVILASSSDDVVYDGVSDSWDFLNTRPDGPVPSDIRILGNDITILAGDTTPEVALGTDFGVTSASVARTFTITNLSGSATINLTSNPEKVVLTDSTGYFSLTQDAGSASLAPGGATTFEITYAPSAGGVHTATVSVASSDSALPVYSFAIGGIRPSAPTVSVQGGSSAGTTSAQLTGLLTGGGVAEAWLVWGDDDAGTTSTGSWDNVFAVGTVTEGEGFTNLVSGLMTNQTYYYRLYVSNGAGSGWSESVQPFSGNPASMGGGGGPGVLIPAPTDSIQGFQSTVIGGNSTDGSDWPGTENPPKAIDGSTSTKYLNRGAVGSGFYITPGTGTTALTEVRVYTANDSSGRDPLTVSIEGANGGDLSQGSSWTLIASSVNLGIDSDPGRYAAGPKVSVEAPVAYTSYRIIVQSIRVPGNSMQFSEFELYGIPGGASSEIANQAPTGISDTDASLNAALEASGTNYNVTVYWGSGDGGADPRLWANSASLGSMGGTGIVSQAVSGLTGGTRYFYAFNASSPDTNVWAQPSWQFVTLGAYTGVDEYGIPDTWKDANTLAGLDWNSLADTDGDGFDNRSEYFAGTDPTNNESLLAIEGTLAVSSNRYEVTWQGVAGKTYKLLYAHSLESASWETNQSGISGVSPQTTTTATIPGTKGFFKIVLE